MSSSDEQVVLDHGFKNHPFDPYPWRCWKCGRSVRLHRYWWTRMSLTWKAR